MKTRRPKGHSVKAMHTRRGDLVWYKGYKYIISDRTERTEKGVMVVAYRQTKTHIPWKTQVVLSKYKPFD